MKITQKIKEIKGILEKKVKEQYKLEAMIKEAQQIDGKKKELGELEESIPKIEKELISEYDLIKNMDYGMIDDDIEKGYLPNDYKKKYERNIIKLLSL